jgi:hypothetical protein
VSVPLMVLLVFVYNLPQLFPVTQPLLGVPFIAGLDGDLDPARRRELRAG